MDVELRQLLQDCELPEDVITWMRDQCEIRCIRHLAHWCSHVGQVERLLFQPLPMRPNHIVLANLRAAWEAASNREHSQALLTHETVSTAPIDADRRNRLQDAWRAQPIIDLPETWQAQVECVDAYLHALECRSITAQPVRGLGNKDSTSAFRAKPDVPELAQYKMVPNDGSAAESDPWKVEFTTTTPWSYLQGLKLDLFALAKAGAEPVQPARIRDAHWPHRLNGLQPSPNVCFQDVSDYLAKFDNFAICFSKKLQPQPGLGGAQPRGTHF